jgi:hypothetical protein
MLMNPAWPRLSSPVKPTFDLQPEGEDAVDAGHHPDADPEIEMQHRYAAPAPGKEARRQPPTIVTPAKAGVHASGDAVAE